MNLYVYAKNNPLYLVDPTGHTPKWLKDTWNSTKKFANDTWNYTKQTVYTSPEALRWASNRMYNDAVDAAKGTWYIADQYAMANPVGAGVEFGLVRGSEFVWNGFKWVKRTVVAGKNLEKININKATIQTAKTIIIKGGNKNKLIDNIISELGTNIKSNPLRKKYEKAVNELASKVSNYKSQGLTDEQIAKKLSQERRELGVKYKNATPPILRDYIYVFNKKRYGDKLGPTFDYLLKKYNGNYKDIIKASSKPNSDIDELLKGGFKQWLEEELR